MNRQTRFSAQKNVISLGKSLGRWGCRTQYSSPLCIYSFFQILFRHEKMNREGSHCKSDPNYSFSSCVKQSISNKLGCKLPWDQQSIGIVWHVLRIQNLWKNPSAIDNDKIFPGVRNCSKMEEFQKYETTYYNLMYKDQVWFHFTNHHHISWIRKNET